MKIDNIWHTSTLLFALWISTSAYADVQYSKEPYDLGRGFKATTTVMKSHTDAFGKSSTQWLFATCFTGTKELVVAIYPDAVIFPAKDQSDGWTPAKLDTRIRYKFDTDADGTNATWYTDSDYKLIRSYDDNNRSFIERIGTANELVALIGNSEIRVSFTLSGTREKIRKVLDACS